jgi:2'-5' RNA ligase
MSYDLDPDLEYFLGITLPEKESTFLAQLRNEIEGRNQLSSPPHITVKPPFMYHFEKPLMEQLEKWAKKQRVFSTMFKKMATFKHKNYATLFLAPQRARSFRELEQNLSESIKFLSEKDNYTPHLTIANRIHYQYLNDVKEKVRVLDLSIKTDINNVTLFEHQKLKPWKIKKVFYFGGGIREESNS